MIIRCKLQNIYRFINVKAGRPILPGIGTNSLGSKFRTGTNCLSNFGRPEHLAAGPSSLIHRFYNKSDKDPTKQFSDEITNELNNMYDYGYIDEKILKYLIPDSPKPGRFYLLPKIHKANNLGRPIVSANGHPTEKNLRICGFPPSPTC